MGTYTASLPLSQKPLFWFGDKFYRVECEIKPFRNYIESISREFYSKCPSCNDAGVVSYTGRNGKEYEIPCPVCSGCGKRENGIELNKWTVHTYIVNKVVAVGPYTKSACTGHVERVTLEAFCRTGAARDDYIETQVPCVENNIDPDLGMLSIDLIFKLKRWKDYAFRKKKDAERLCVLLKEYDRQRLKDFNDTHGTVHQYPY